MPSQEIELTCVLPQIYNEIVHEGEGRACIRYREETVPIPEDTIPKAVETAASLYMRFTLADLILLGRRGLAV